MSLIVVIEDNPEVSRMVVKLLRAREHKVIVAEDGETGLTTVFEHHPDLVLIDLGLPDIDGQTVIALIKQQPELSNTLLVAFTAFQQDVAQQMATAYGCHGVITKPIDTRTFASQLEAFIAKPTG